MKHYFLQRF